MSGYGFSGKFLGTIISSAEKFSCQKPMLLLYSLIQLSIDTRDEISMNFHLSSRKILSMLNSCTFQAKKGEKVVDVLSQSIRFEFYIANNATFFTSQESFLFHYHYFLEQVSEIISNAILLQNFRYLLGTGTRILFFSSSLAAPHFLCSFLEHGLSVSFE